MPFFMGHRENNGGRVFWWRYNVRIESLQEVRVQLKERQWRIYSVAGTLETVTGKGVIGQVKQDLVDCIVVIRREEWPAPVILSGLSRAT